MEVVVVRPDPLDPEHLGHQLRDQRGGLAGGRGLLAARRATRLRQCPAVDLAAFGQRQLRQHFDLPRDHVGGKALAEVAAQLLGVELDPIGGLGVADQPLVARNVLAGDDGGVADAGMEPEHLADLPRLDPVAGDLHLVIDPAEEGVVAARQAAEDVAGAVDPAAAGEAVGAEAVGGPLGVAAVAAGDAGTADPELTGLALGDLLASLVE